MMEDVTNSTEFRHIEKQSKSGVKCYHVSKCYYAHSKIRKKNHNLL